MNKEIANAKTLNTITEEHHDLQQIRGELKSCQDQLTHDKQVIAEAEVKNVQYQAEI